MCVCAVQVTERPNLPAKVKERVLEMLNAMAKRIVDNGSDDSDDDE